MIFTVKVEEKTYVHHENERPREVSQPLSVSPTCLVRRLVGLLGSPSPTVGLEWEGEDVLFSYKGLELRLLSPSSRLPLVLPVVQWLSTSPPSHMGRGKRQPLIRVRYSLSNLRVQERPIRKCPLL